MTVAIIDIRMGNIGSIVNMVKYLGQNAEILSCPSTLHSYKKIILPGVGHFAEAMKRLTLNGWVPSLEKARNDDASILGICLGMQVMTRFSEEGNCEGLGWFDLNTKRFPVRSTDCENIRVPHMGWNNVVFKEGLKPFSFIDYQRYYFVHSYFVDGVNSDDCYGITDYQGISFASAIIKKKIIGVQFHPEKSHRCGKILFQKFLNLE